MSKQEKKIEESLIKFYELNKKSKHQPEKLEADEQNRLLLDPNNPYHMAWYYNDGEYG